MIRGLGAALFASMLHGLPVRGMASQSEARPPCERPGLPVRGQVSLSEARPACERTSLPVRGPASL